MQNNVIFFVRLLLISLSICSFTHRSWLFLKWECFVVHAEYTNGIGGVMFRRPKRKWHFFFLCHQPPPWRKKKLCKNRRQNRVWEKENVSTCDFLFVFLHIFFFIPFCSFEFEREKNSTVQENERWCEHDKENKKKFRKNEKIGSASDFTKTIFFIRFTDFSVSYISHPAIYILQYTIHPIP